MASAMAGMPLPADLYANKSYKLVVTTVVSFILATIGIVGRFSARFICRKSLELNDYFIIAGYIMKLGLTVLSSFLIKYGIGRHVQTLSLAYVESYLKGTWTGSFIYAPAIAFVKLSILSLFYVAFPSRFMRSAVWILAAITTAWGIALCLVGLFACIPVHKSWQPTTPGHCIDTYAYYYGLQIPNIITDFVILLLPFKGIIDLHLPKTQLAQIGGVLSLGLVTCAFDIIRLVVFIQMPRVLDITWVNLAPAMWLDLELSVAILVACLPVMRPLLHPRRFWRMNRTETSDTRPESYGRVSSPTESDHIKLSSTINTYDRGGSAGSTADDYSKGVGA